MYYYGRVFTESSTQEFPSFEPFYDASLRSPLMLNLSSLCEQLGRLYLKVQSNLNLETGIQDEYVSDVEDKIGSGGTTLDDIDSNDFLS